MVNAPIFGTVLILIVCAGGKFLGRELYTLWLYGNNGGSNDICLWGCLPAFQWHRMSPGQDHQIFQRCIWIYNDCIHSSMTVYLFIYMNICVNKILCINVCELFEWSFQIDFVFSCLSAEWWHSSELRRWLLQDMWVSTFIRRFWSNALSCQFGGWAPCCLAVDGLIGLIIGDVACCRGCRLSLLLAYHYIFPGLPILFLHLVLTFSNQHSPGKRNVL